jgi:GT2 family glycosyltransferase
MEILVIGVSYNSDQEALRFVKSLSEISPERGVKLSVILVDNSDREKSCCFFERVRATNPEVDCVKSPENLGYFGGARLGLQSYLRKKPLPDWTIVANVDLEFQNSEFLSRLSNFPDFKDVGAIAPMIWSVVNQVDWNPKIRSKPSSKRMHLYELLYSSYYVYNLYLLLFILKSLVRRFWNSLNSRLKNPNREMSPQVIYAPHGACVILSKRYFQLGGDLDYPIFLYGEEFFVAETVRELGLRVIYDPTLRVRSFDHSATGRFPKSREIASYHYDSTVYVVDKYFS